LEILRSWFQEKIDFSKIIFSDESRFSLDGPKNQSRWHFIADEPICTPSRVMEGDSIMVFGLIGVDGLLSIRKIEGIVNGEKYVQLMDKDIIHMLKARYKSKFIFQKDNARPHTSKTAKGIFMKHKIRMLTWLPHSPDLSIIENVWHIMLVQVYDGQIFQNKTELWEKITMVAAAINEENPSKIKVLYSSIIKRYLDVIEKHGDNI